MILALTLVAGIAIMIGLAVLAARVPRWTAVLPVYAALLGVGLAAIQIVYGA